jgi:hypothetical protein
MKGLKLSLVIMAAALLTIGLSGMAYAFHDGGVAYCEGCHTMHNSSGGAAVTTKGGASQFQGVNYLLKGSDQSSTCLNCHSGATLSSYHVYTTGTLTGVGPANYTPGGDFAWLTKSYAAASDLHSTAVPGERHGHNIIANDFSLLPDVTLTKAPGGSYSANNLMCISCHDPHPSARIDSNNNIVRRALGSAVPPIYSSGSYGAAPTATEAVGVYRLLGASGYVPKSYAGGPTFANDPPIAVAPKSYNKKETSADIRVAYGKGMSEWCANCHTSIHADNVSSNFIHPASNVALLKGAVDIAANYNAYVKSGDLTGNQATSYTSMVPYEEGSSDRAFLLGQTTKTTGPITGTENVMCLTCHRAHASGFRSMTRWNNDTEFITEASIYLVSTAAGTMNATEYLAAMYDRPPTASMFATYQRSLCNKCHAKD